MLWWVVLVGLALFLLYAIRVLFFNLEEDPNTSLDDFIKDAPEDENEQEIAAKRADLLSKYYTRHEEPGRQLLILYGTEYGFSEEVARLLFDRTAASEALQSRDVQPRVLNSSDFEKVDWNKERLVFCVFSTTGDGVCPTDSRPFFDFLSSLEVSSLPFSHLSFAVLALGDYNYTHFCRTGKILDARLCELGGSRVCDRVDVDLEDWGVINKWVADALETVLKQDLPLTTDYLELSMPEEDTGVSRTRPFSAQMTVKYNLTSISDGPASDKETFHAEFDLTDSQLSYTSGDALGIYPLNNPPEVAAMLSALHADEDTQVPVPQSCYTPRPQGERMPLGRALLCYYDLKTVKLDLVKLLSESASSEKQRRNGEELLKDGLSKKNEALSTYLSEREVVDVLEDFSTFRCRLEDILLQLRPLQPRYYSIASSPLTGLKSVCVCVAVVRYSLLSKPRTGVCTTYLQDRFSVGGGSCPVFISQNPDFRLPKDTSLPIIMIGPGTGIAPFRAFIQERVLTKATGTNLLYFGCRHKKQDFLYKSELEKWEGLGVLELRTAFSRDQAHKVYVQHLITEDADKLWKLIEAGAHVYVCGDAVNMAGDVHQALLRAFQEQGGMGESQAHSYMEALEKAERYQRDVWVT